MAEKTPKTIDHAWKPEEPSDDKDMGFVDAAEDMFDRYAEETENAVESAGRGMDNAGDALESGVRRSWMERDDYDEWKESKD